MQPMIAIATPGRWPVRSEICAVTSCRSKSVRPHEGHETNSVLVERMREPCSRPKDVVRSRLGVEVGAGLRLESDAVAEAVAEQPAHLRAELERELDLSDGGARWWITAQSMPRASSVAKSAARRVQPRELVGHVEQHEGVVARP